MSKKIFNQEIIIIGIIILTATIVRLIALFNFGTFCFDDIFAVHFSKMNVEKMFYFLKDEVHPPFYFLLLHFWLRLFGQNEIIARLPSLIFSLGCIPLLYCLTKKMLNKWCAIFVALLFALSYFQIFTASQVRMYSLLPFLGLGSLILFWLIVVENKKNLWFFYIAITVAALLTHLGGIFTLLIQYLWLSILIWQKQIAKEKIKKYIYSQIPILLLWSAWLIPLFLPKLKTIMNQGWYFNDVMNRSFAIGIYDYFFLMLKNYWLRLITGTIIFSAPFMILLWPDKKISARDGSAFDGKNNNKINPLWFLFAWAVPATAISVIFKINYARIFTISYLGFYLIIAYLFYITFQNRRKLFWFLIIIWFGISIFNLEQNLNKNFVRWDLANQWLVANQNQGEKIIIGHFINQLAFEKYYTGSLDYESLYPLENDNSSLEQKIIKKNWQKINAEILYKNLEATTRNNQKIFLVLEQPQSPFNAKIKQWFKKNGWQAADIFQPDALFGPEAILYIKN